MGLEACSWGLVLVLAKPQLNLLAPHLKKKKIDIREWTNNSMNCHDMQVLGWLVHIKDSSKT